MPSLRTIAVGIDGSAGSEAALAWACELARFESATLLLVTVIPLHRSHPGVTGLTLEAGPGERRWYHAALRRAATTARRAGVSNVETVALEGAAVDALVEFVESRAPDLLVLGARGLSRTRRVLLGSVSEGVLHHGRGPVLIVRAPSEAPSASAPRARSFSRRISPK